MEANDENWKDPWMKAAEKEYETMPEYSIENGGEQATLFALPDGGESMILSPEPITSPKNIETETSHWLKQLSDSTISSSSTTKFESLDPEIEAVKEESASKISLFQQFRAVTPRSSGSFAGKAGLMNAKMVKVEKPIISIKTPAEIQSLSINEFPSGVKHQRIATKSIQQVFNDLLDARESLILKADKLETERIIMTDELRQVEEILTEFNMKKKDLMFDINQRIVSEDKALRKLDLLNSKISEIGSESVKLETSIRSICGDRSLLVPEEEQIEPFACIKTLFGHEESVECLDFETPYGHLVSGSADKTLKIWDLSTNECLGTLEGHKGWIRAVQLCGYSVMSGSGDHTAKLWDITPFLDNDSDDDTQSNEDPSLKQTFEGHDAGVNCLQFLDNTLVTGSADRTIRQWDIETGQSINILRSELPLQSMESSLDKVLHGHKDYDEPIAEGKVDLAKLELRVWDDSRIVEPSSPPKTSKIYNTGGHVGDLFFWQYALAAGYGDGIVRLFDLRSGHCHRQLLGHTGAVTSITFEDNLIISGSMDRTVKIWELRMGTVIDDIDCPGSINHIFTDYSRFSISCSMKSVLLYQRSNGRAEYLDGHAKFVRATKAVGNRLISGGMDSCLKIWNCEPFPVTIDAGNIY